MKRIILSLIVSAFAYGQNVGIGTATPSAKLHIVGGVDASLTSHGFLMLGNVNSTNIIIDNNEIMARNNGGTSTLYLQLDGGNLVTGNAGRVGLGIGAPTHKLHVNGDVRVSTLAGTGTRPVYATNQGVLTTTAPNPDVFWRTTGNTGITTAHFLGTINNADLNIRTNNTLRFRIENWGARLRANDNGSAGAPNYSWLSDTDIGMYRITTNTLGFSTAGVERFRLETGEAVINDNGYNYDFRVETNNETHALFVDGGQDVIGIRTIPTGPWVITGTPVNEIFYPMEIGSTTSHDHQAAIGYWRNSDVEINPETDWYGYVGYSTEAWYRGYSYGWNNVSDRSKKTNIVELNNNEPIASIILNDIENLNPTLYNYKGEKEFPKNNYDTKVRYQYHLGLLADEVPAYVADESFSAVNIYESVK